MTTNGLVQRSLSLAAFSLIGIAPMAVAQGGSGQELFEWNGRVDREVQIVMRGNNLWTRNVGQSEPGRAHTRTFTTLPRQDGDVVVRLLDGRGDVDVIQQPTSQNGYTTIVRIQDARSGADNYRLTAYWQAYANGDYVGRNRGRGRARGQVDRNDRDDRDDIYRNRDNHDNRDTRDNRDGRYGSQTMLHWSGNVDNELEIRIQNGRVDYRTISGAQPTNIRSDQGNLSVPRSGAGVSVTQNQGRGTVVVLQQPSSWNGYTTVIRVRDPQGGYGFYDFNLMWQ